MTGAGEGERRSGPRPDAPRPSGRGGSGLALFLAAMAAFAFAGGLFETTFNNLLDDRYAITAAERGWLEFPRELPGFLVAAGVGVLAIFAGEPRMAAFAAALTGLGMLGIAHLSPARPSMIAFMIVWSAGIHLLMPLRGSLALRLAAGRGRGTLIGKLGGIGNLGVIAACGLVWALWRSGARSYGLILTIGSAACVAAAIGFGLLRFPGTAPAATSRRAPPFVLRRRYGLFYLLALLFGARKQVFITFGPWVLVKVFHCEPDIFARLWLIAHVIGIPVKPLIGRAVDRFGERAVLLADGILLLAVCLTYAGAERILGHRGALAAVASAYVVDHLLFAVQMARTTYLDKIAFRSRDVTPTLSLAVSINHAVSMSIPILGGWAWVRYGYPAVFVFAAGIALLVIAAAARVRTPAESDGEAPV